MSVLYVDIDCFYVQAECFRRPELRGRPVVIQQVQHGGFIALSYEARASGVKRGDGIGATGPRSVGEVKKRCPDLVIVPVDMPHNRFVSQEVEVVLRSISPRIVLQRNSVDDFCIDCSAEVARDDFEVPVHDESIQAMILLEEGGTVDEKRIPMNSKNASEILRGLTKSSTTRSALFALHLQRTLFQRMRGMTCSIGLAKSKVIARMVVSRNKPFGITILSDVEDSALAALLREIPVARVHGLRGLAGQHISNTLAPLVGKSADQVMLKDVQQFSRQELAAIFDVKTASFLDVISHGEDAEPISDRGQPKSILVELSWDPIETDIEIYEHLRPLVEDLLHRILEDSRRFDCRRPTKYTVKWRRTSKMLTGSQVLAMPTAVASLIRRANEKPEAVPISIAEYPKAVEECCEAGMRVVKKALKDVLGPRELNRLAIVASEFVQGGPSLLSFMKSPREADQPALPSHAESRGKPTPETVNESLSLPQTQTDHPHVLPPPETRPGGDAIGNTTADGEQRECLKETAPEVSSGDDCVLIGSKDQMLLAVEPPRLGVSSNAVGAARPTLKRRRIIKSPTGEGSTLLALWKRDDKADTK